MHEVRGAMLALLLVSGVAQAGSISLSIVEPKFGQVQAYSMHVVVHVESTLQIDAMEAQVGSLSSPMLPFSTGNWSTRMSIDSLPYGQHTLTVTARDAEGQTATASRSFFVDRPPQLVVQSPIPYTVASPRLRVEATCTDDDQPPCELEVLLVRESEATSRAPVLASGTGAVSADLDASAFAADRKAFVMIRGRLATMGGYPYKTIPFYVVDHPRLARAFEAPGVVLAFDSQRVLAHEELKRYTLLRRSDGEPLWQFEITWLRDARISGLLTPAGAFVLPADMVGREWRNGEVLEHTVHEAEGPFALIETADGLAVHDYRHGTDHPVRLPPEVQLGERDLTPRGEVVFSRKHTDSTDMHSAVYRFRRGRVEQIASAEKPRLRMRSDGTHTVYYRSDLWPELRNPVPLLNLDGVETALGEVRLAPSSQTQVRAAAREGYLVYNAHEGGVNQLFRRNPQGEVEQITLFGSDSELEELAPNGELMFLHKGTRYFARPGQLPIDLGPPLGRVSFLDGEWYVHLGTTVFQVRLAAEERPPPGPAWDAPPVPDHLDEEPHASCGCSGGKGTSVPWSLVALWALLAGARRRLTGCRSW